MLIQIFVPPIVQLVILSHAMTFEVKQTNLALVDLDRSPASTRLVDAFTSTGRFDVALYTASSDRADRAILAREASVILRIPEGFGRRLVAGDGPGVQLILNAEDGAAAGVIQSYASQILAGFAESETRPGGTRAGPRTAARIPGSGPVTPSRIVSARPGPGIHITTRTLYNPEREYLQYMAIGLLASLMTLIGVLLTSQNIAREKEIGTLEQLNVTPITRTQFLTGKLIPFWILGMIELTLGLAVIRFVFGFGFEGSVGLVYAGAAVYLPAALGLGLLISTIAETQQQAQFVTFFVIVTFFFLGGIFTPIQSMPPWAQTLAAFDPIKHFVFLLRTVLMKGGGVADILPALGAMAAFAVGALGLALARYHKTAS
jgi:ABC-2 type transport system permease protein